MIVTPVSVTASVTTLLAAVDVKRGKAVILENTGSEIARVRWDGSATALTYANGISLLVGERLVIENDNRDLANVVQAICNTGLTTTVNVHVIE